jgi:hypothetical protein
MCGFYDDNQKIKKNDIALYKNEEVLIKSATHIKQNRTMDIIICDKQNIETLINIPYMTAGFGFELIKRGNNEKI